MTLGGKTRSGKTGVSFLGFFNRSVVLTYAGVAVAVLGMWLAHTARLEGALICLVLAGLADLFDGPIARRVSRDADARRFGQEIDSLADMFSFIGLPVVIAFSLGLQSMWWLPVLAFYALAGLIRLAYFNTTTRTDAADGHAADQVRHYRGVPVTYVALILPVAALTTTALPAPASAWLVGAVIAMLGTLFVVDMPVRKPTGASYAVFGVVAIAVVTALSLVEL